MANKTISFVKYSATGNDFIVLDNRKKTLAGKQAVLFARLACDRTIGIGADGLLLLEKSSKADFRMRIINADGSEAEMCGNGSRAIAHFAYSRRWVKKETDIETRAGLLHAQIKDKDVVKVKLTRPQGFRKNIQVKCGSTIWKGHFINTGVPHFVTFVHDLEKVDVYSQGRSLRYHPFFQPTGTNVNFVRVLARDLIQVRTYERGVENETLACGTGSTASAIISSLVKGLHPPVKVKTRSGEMLRIYFRMDKDGIEDVFLEGSVHPVFSGSVKFSKKRIQA